MDQNHKKLTKSRDRSEGKLGLFLVGFSILRWIKEKIGGKFVINRALDTNMLGGNPGVGPIIHEFHEKRGGKRWSGNEIEEGDEIREHKHTKTRYTPTPHAGGNRSNIIPRIGVGRSSLSTPTTGDEVLGETLTTWGRDTENPRPCTT